MSITFDPYCLLSLPLPTVNDFVQAVNVVYADRARPITRYHVVTSKLASLTEFVQSLSLITSVPAGRFVLADVWNHRLFKVLEDDSTVSDIRPGDLIYAYELPELDHIKPQDVLLCQIAHVKVDLSARPTVYDLRSEAFGLPLAMALNKKQMVTGKQIAAQVDRALRGWVKDKADVVPPQSSTSSTGDWYGAEEGRPAGEGQVKLEGAAEGQVKAEGAVTGQTEAMEMDGPGYAEGAPATAGGEELNNSYVLVKNPSEDALMQRSEGADGELMGEGPEGVPNPASPSSSPSSDPLPPYRILLQDTDMRHCFRCSTGKHCSGCPLPIDDEAVALTASELPRWGSERSELKLTLALEWDIASAFPRYDAERETVVEAGGAGSSTLASGEETQRVHLSDCIAAFTKEETLTEQDQWWCSACKDFRCATKKMDLFSLPRLLIIHLKRFAYTSRSREKISTFVDFPIAALDLSHLAHPSTAQAADGGAPPAPALYDLWAVSNHMGGLGGGHYTAYVKNRVTGGWYLHDDSRVTPVSEEDIKTSSAYVLFYSSRELLEDEHAHAGQRAQQQQQGEEGDKGGFSDDSDSVKREQYMELSDGMLDADGVPTGPSLIADHFGSGVKREGSVTDTSMDDASTGRRSP